MSFGLVLGLVAAVGAASTTLVTELAPDVHFIAGAFIEGRQPDGNSVIFGAAEGLIVIDTGRHREHTQELLDFARESGAPIKAVINTHWHLDHVGGNILVRQSAPGVRIYASSAIEDAMTGFLANYRTQLEKLIASAADRPEDQSQFRTELALIAAGPQLAPDEVVTRSGPRQIAGRDLELHLETRAVTAGDVWVLDAASGILAAGDLVTLPVPFFETACPERWATALQGLSDAKFTRLVPGHGDPMSREAFESYRAGFSRLLACADSERTDEDCAAGWIHDLGSLVADADDQRVREMLRYYMETSLRGDPASVAKRCGA